MILVALAAVFVFLAVEGIPGMNKPATNYAPFDNFWRYVGTLLFGTILAALVALVIAVPFALGIALFISHYAPRALAVPVAYVIDLLAAVPSVVFGLWGARVLGHYLIPAHGWLDNHLGFIPFFDGPASVTGKTVLTAGMVLAIMILPIITAICREIFAQAPRLNEEAALALGATKWEMVRLSVFPYARSGMVSAVMLGLGRALGETMAVAMVLSASPVVTLNMISNTNPATIASNIASQLRRGHARQAGRADRHRAGAVRVHLRGQLRRPRGRGPLRAEVRSDDRPRRAARRASLPLTAPRGCRAGRRTSSACSPARAAGLLALLAGLGHHGLRGPGRRGLPRRLPALVAEHRGPPRRHRPADDLAGVDDVRRRRDPAGLADLDGARQRAARDQRRASSPSTCAT